MIDLLCAGLMYVHVHGVVQERVSEFLVPFVTQLLEIIEKVSYMYVYLCQKLHAVNNCNLLRLQLSSGVHNVPLEFECRC